MFCRFGSRLASRPSLSDAVLGVHAACHWFSEDRYATTEARQIAVQSRQTAYLDRKFSALVIPFFVHTFKMLKVAFGAAETIGTYPLS